MKMKNLFGIKKVVRKLIKNDTPKKEYHNGKNYPLRFF